MQLLEITTALRFWCDNLKHAIDNYLALEVKSERTTRLQSAVTPMVPGASVVVGISLSERLVMDLVYQEKGGMGIAPRISFGELTTWRSVLGLDPKWYGWHLLVNFIRLRHCFAHEYGRLTEKQDKHIREFLACLKSQAIKDENGEPVQPYYSIGANREIELKPEALDCFRRLMGSFLSLLQGNGYIKS